jgi:hypothetical protein
MPYDMPSFGNTSIYEGSHTNKPKEVQNNINVGAGMLPFQTFSQFRSLANTGMFGAGGIDQIKTKMMLSNLLRRRALAKGLNSNWGSRLGARGAAGDIAFANADVGNQAALNELIAGLIEKNQLSKIQGMQGMSDLSQAFLANREQKKQGGGIGWGDILGGAVGLGSILFSGGATAPAVAAKQTQRWA